MPGLTSGSKESIIVLFQSGRSPEWDRVPNTERSAIEQEHVDLMLSVARAHGMKEMCGFRLVMPQHTWKLFWIMEFPTLAGAEAWMQAEIAPPYGLYGFHQYHLARRSEAYPGTQRADAIETGDRTGDPHQIPALNVDRSSFVALAFVRRLPTPHDAESDVEAKRRTLLDTVADTHQLLRHETYTLITPQREWRQVWVTEFATLEGIEAWIEAQSRPPDGSCLRADYYLARKWAPEYFASWILQ